MASPSAQARQPALVAIQDQRSRPVEPAAVERPRPPRRASGGQLGQVVHGLEADSALTVDEGRDDHDGDRDQAGPDDPGGDPGGDAGSDAGGAVLAGAMRRRAVGFERHAVTSMKPQGGALGRARNPRTRLASYRLTERDAEGYASW